MAEQTIISKYKQLKKKAWCGIWGKRILSELYYLIELSRVNDNQYDALLEQAVDELTAYVQENGAITKAVTEELESMLSPMAALAKSLNVILVGHAHIDMNWMWGFQETAAVTVDTFSTMLQLMEEYPQFTFSQSQASVYRIIEEYYPNMLDKIRQRVKEGRWEVNATTWVENDKNMTGSESNARHILYSKEYLSRLLDMPAEEFCLDFEPDTFGHNENMPEYLSQGGIKYYYHCRGYDGEFIYRWQAPSGAEVLVYREPVWYNDWETNYDSLGYVPSICNRYGLKTALKFYGVGDHGGGPTRRDIEHWLEMQTWPLMPVIEFGTLKQFFRTLESVRAQLPVVRQELNYVFTGCYTSQARIKRANKIAEDRLYESELVDTFAGAILPDYQQPNKFDRAWETVLFNQFHDILPGSGVRDTYEYALGQFQKTMAISQINQKHAMQQLCSRMDTSAFGNWSGSLGSGVGFGTEDACNYVPSYAEQGGGIRRIFTVFNTTPYRRTELVKVVLWDWQGDTSRLYAATTGGNEIPCEVLSTGTHYWSHHYHAVSVLVDVPPMGYSSYIIDERPEESFNDNWSYFAELADPQACPRNDHLTDEPIVLENACVKAVFCPNTMQLLSFMDKQTGLEQIQTPACSFRLITEDTREGMTSWRVGNYKKVVNLNETQPVRIRTIKAGLLHQSIAYEIPFGNGSCVKAEVSLPVNSETLQFALKADWHELGNRDGGVPQLNFFLPLGYAAKEYLCNIPGGILARGSLSQDVPCTGFMAASGAESKILSLMSDSKYGFRGCYDTMAIDLLRASYDPDPSPDQGEHTIHIGVAIVDNQRTALAVCYERFIHPLYAFGNQFHKGNLPVSASWLQVSDGVRIQAIKQAQDGNGMIIRLQNLLQEENPVTLQLLRDVKQAELVTLTEDYVAPLTACKESVSFTMGASTVRSVRIVLN